jgi:hypothetical protein
MSTGQRVVLASVASLLSCSFVSRYRLLTGGCVFGGHSIPGTLFRGIPPEDA